MKRRCGAARRSRRARTARVQSSGPHAHDPGRHHPPPARADRDGAVDEVDGILLVGPG